MWLDSLLATGITAVSLVVILYYSQLRGWIYFKPQVDELRKDRDAQIEAVRLEREERVREARVDRDARVAEVRSDRDARLAEKDREIQNLWEAVTHSEHGRLEALAQSGRLLEGMETAVQVVAAIPTPTEIVGE